MVPVSFRLKRVFPKDKKRLQVTMLHGFEHAREVQAAFGRNSRVPCLLEFKPVGLDFHMLKTRKPIGQGSHVSAALNIVLATERIEAAGVFADMPRQQGKIDEGGNIVHAVVVFRDSKSPADHRLFCGGVSASHFVDQRSGHAAQALGLGKGERFHSLPVGVETRRGVIDKPAVVPSLGDDLPPHRVGHHNVGANIQARPCVGPAYGTGAAGIHGDQPRAIVNPLEKVMKKDRVGLTGIGSPQEDDIRLLDFPVGVCPTAHPEHCRQTDDTRGVSGAITTVDIVRAHHHPSELLGDEVHFIGALGATENPKGAIAMLGAIGLESGGDRGQRLIPTGASETGRLSNQRMRQAGPSDEFAVDFHDC